MSGTKSFRQDMPPKGGYAAINWAKVGGKKRLSGYATFGIAGGISLVAWIGYYFETKAKQRVYLEMNDARIAISPLLLAEEHRLYLKQLRANRDEENELMKNVPGWETGKLNGEPVYHNLNNRFPVVLPEAYYAHTSWNAMYDRYYERRKH
jgi:NADH dehydrogenase (ubiquinone) 1 alpha subcomplex subunit 13